MKEESIKEINEPEAPRLTKLSIKQIDAPIELYKIDIVRSEDGGRRIKNYANKTRDYEWWVEPEDRCWNVPDGDYLISQGPGLWRVNVDKGDVSWWGLHSLAQKITAHWNKLTIEDLPAEPKGLSLAPIIASMEGDSETAKESAEIVKARMSKNKSGKKKH